MGRPTKEKTRESECQTNGVACSSECGGIFPGEKWLEKKIKEATEKLSATFQEQVSKLQKEILELKSTIDLLERSSNSLNDLQQVTDTAVEQLQVELESFQLRQNSTVTKLHKQVIDQTTDLKQIKGGIDNLEQKNKENNLRIVGLTEEEGEDLKNKVISLAKNKLQILNISRADINDICRMGRKMPGKSRDIKVTFASTAKKNIMYSARKKIPYDAEEPIYINEDLTKFRSLLFYQARKLKQRSKIFGTWTQDGNVLIKLKEHSQPQAIETNAELKEVLCSEELQQITTADAESEVNIFDDEYSDA